MNNLLIFLPTTKDHFLSICKDRSQSEGFTLNRPHTRPVPMTRGRSWHEAAPQGPLGQQSPVPENRVAALWGQQHVCFNKSVNVERLFLPMYVH